VLRLATHVSDRRNIDAILSAHALNILPELLDAAADAIQSLERLPNVDGQTGVDRKKSEHSGSERNYPGNITRVDIEEFCIFWGCDILDIGFWYIRGKKERYEPPDMDLRLEHCIQDITDCLWEEGFNLGSTFTTAELMYFQREHNKRARRVA